MELFQFSGQVMYAHYILTYLIENQVNVMKYFQTFFIECYSF